MNPRPIMVLAVAAGLATIAKGQTANVSCTVTFVETQLGTNTPVASPNGVLEPGESLRLQVSELVTPAIGSPISYMPPPGSGLGTLAGLGWMWIDVHGTGGTYGTFERFGNAPGWTLGSGTADPDGTGVVNVQAAQYIFPGSTANPTNPVINIWHGVWTPISYTSRIVTFTTAGAAAAGGNPCGVYVQYGVDANGDPLYTTTSATGTFDGASFQVAPAPASLALLGLSGLAAASRRRGRMVRP